MGFNIRGGDKSSLALLSSKRGRAYARTRADEAFALPSFSDAIPVSTSESQRPSNNIAQPEQPVEHDAENVKQTMLEHESVFKEQLHELHRLYQKQCMLMAESKTSPTCDRLPEPPSSNSSFLYNPETLRMQEERSFGDASCTKFWDSNQTYNALLGRIDDAKRFEDCGSSGKLSNHQLLEVGGLSRKQSSHQMLDLEKPTSNRPIIDLERPADEYMDVEVQEEKPLFAPVCSHFSEDNKRGEKRELFSVESKGLWDMGFQRNSDTRISEKIPLGSREEMLEGCLRHKESANKSTTFNEGCFSSSSGPKSAPACLKEESPLYSKEALSACGVFRGLPDLNGDVNFAEQQSSPTHAFSEKNVKERQYIDLEIDSRSCSSTSKLPHWLCQAPPTRPFASHVSAPTPVCQPRTSIFLPPVHDKTTKTSFFVPQVHDKTNWRSSLPTEMTKASFTQEPDFPWLQSRTSLEQGEVSFRELSCASSSQVLRGANAGIAERSYPGVLGKEYMTFSTQVRDSEKMRVLNTSANSFSKVMGSQGPEFETRGPSAEPLSRVISEGSTTFSNVSPWYQQRESSSVSPWYQQRESFSSLMQQASNPEPFCDRSSPAFGVNQWDSAFNYQGRLFGMDYLDRGIYGLHTHDVRNTEGSSCRPQSTAGPAFDLMHAGSELHGTQDVSMKGNESPSCKQIETPLRTGQAPKTPLFIEQAPEVSTGNHHRDLDSRNNLFDLNVSSEDCMPEGNFVSCNVIGSSCCGNQQQSLKQESETSRSSSWHTLSGIKASYVYEPQRESGLQDTGFRDNVATKGTSSVLLIDINAAHLHNETSFLLKAAENLRSEGDMVRDDICEGYCSGEDEAGGGILGVKSSDGSGLTSCESRDAVHLELTKARDDSNTSSGEACHSRESRIPNHKEEVAFSSGGLPSQLFGVFGSQFESYLYPNMQTLPSLHEGKRDSSAYNSTEFGDESKAANVVANEDLDEAAEAAELLLSLGFDMPSMPGDEFAVNDCVKCLDLLADIIPHDDYCQPKDIDVEVDAIGKHEVSERTLEISAEKGLEPFELAVLALKPVDPHLECFATTEAMDRSNVVENIHTLRRRPSRRGRAGKDFQKELLRSMTSLSRHQVTEDFQIIEGLIKSAAEAGNSCLLSPDDKPLSSPEQGSLKSFGKVKGTKYCRGGKLNGALKVCSWGESTRRKRMGRQRSQWLSLPPGVRTSLFANNAAHVPF